MVRSLLLVAFAATAYASSIGVFPGLGESECPLCGQSPVVLERPEPDQSVNILFDICCPFKDNHADDSCVFNPKTESERLTRFATPLVEGIDFVDMCVTFDQIQYIQSDRTPCCEVCTCYGDPNCISFDKIYELWIVCDGRDVPLDDPTKLRRGFCPITQNQCESEVDTFGNQCVWAPERDGISNSKWSVAKYGSPCQPEGLAKLNMYTTGNFSVDIFQGERGNIKLVELEFSTGSFAMTADDCVNEEEPWTGDDVPLEFNRTVDMYSSDEHPDIVWHLYDPGYKIGVVIRCTARHIGGERRNARINVEQILDPEPNRANGSGFCISNTLGNTNPSPNTLMIQENGYCHINAPSTAVTIARKVCQNPSIMAGGVGQCYKQFCNNFYMPFFASFDECYEMITNTENPKRWEETFCKAFTSPSEPLDFKECEDLIEEEGWGAAVDKYYQTGVVVDEATCFNSFAELPDFLAPCEKGVLLQYLDTEIGEWVTIKAFSENRPPCTDAALEICIDEFPKLFTETIRFVQKRETLDCITDKCTPQNGFSIRITPEVTTKSPTVSPTRSPTVSPTRNPTASPTPSPTNTPTVSPTPSPSNSPTVSPTRNPTVSPTPRPTEDPTVSPTPSPTEDPTVSPTPSPTEDPTVEPTDAPSAENPPPTEAPFSFSTGAPVPLQTRSPTTPEPTASPTVSPTNAPSTSPTFECVPEPKECPVILTTESATLPEATTEYFEQGSDRVWVITEPTSGILTTVRCSSNIRNGQRFQARLGIEDVVDPDDERYSCGFCPTDFLGVSGSTEITDFLDSTEQCAGRPEIVDVGQAICRTFVQRETIGTCIGSFCSKQWFPNYKNPNECVKLFDKRPDRAFCRALFKPNTADYRECLDSIEEEGWNNVVDKYYPRIYQECSTDPKDFPDALTDCQGGAEIQYFDGSEWITVLGVPSLATRSVCAEGLDFDARSYPELFKYPVRVHQKSIDRVNCLGHGVCEVTPEVSTKISYTRDSECDDSTPDDTMTSPDVPAVDRPALCDVLYNPDSCLQVEQMLEAGTTYEAVLAQLPECCVAKDTTPLEGQTLGAQLEFSRSSQTCSAVCDPALHKCCNDLGRRDTMNIQIVFEGTMRDGLCCKSCTCYGDPRCISFEGTRKSWIPCDARDVSTTTNTNTDFCQSSREICESLVDPAGNQCEWKADTNISVGWDILALGGPCKPSEEGRISCINMYETEEFELCLSQGDRGILVQAIVRLGEVKYMINAEECFAEENPWKIVTTA